MSGPRKVALTLGFVVLIGTCGLIALAHQRLGAPRAIDLHGQAYVKLTDDLGLVQLPIDDASVRADMYNDGGSFFVEFNDHAGVAHAFLVHRPMGDAAKNGDVYYGSIIPDGTGVYLGKDTRLIRLIYSVLQCQEVDEASGHMRTIDMVYPRYFDMAWRLLGWR